jgi:hypothetical protein
MIGASPARRRISARLSVTQRASIGVALILKSTMSGRSDASISQALAAIATSKSRAPMPNARLTHSRLSVIASTSSTAAFPGRTRHPPGGFAVEDDASCRSDEVTPTSAPATVLSPTPMNRPPSTHRLAPRATVLLHVDGAVHRCRLPARLSSLDL